MKRLKRFSLLTPIYLWVIITVLFPLGYIFVLSFLSRGEMFGVEWKLTLDNYIRITSPLYMDIFVSSGKIALATTLLTLTIAYPFAYIMAVQPGKLKSMMMILVIIPFWTSALLRTYGWKVILQNKGLLNDVLLMLKIIKEPLSLLNTRGAVLIGMAYTLLPFMILPIYTSLEKLDGLLIKAARDLGAGPVRAFLTVTLPLSLPGVLSGCVMVFVPSVGMFFISDLLGGGTSMLLGNLIHNQLTISRDWPFGAALSMIMIALTFITMGIYRRYVGAEPGVF